MRSIPGGPVAVGADPVARSTRKAPLGSGSGRTDGSERVEAALSEVEGQLTVALGSPSRVSAALGELTTELSARGTDDLPVAWRDRLCARLEGQTGPVAEAVLDFLEEQARGAADPAPILAGMFRTRSASRHPRTLDLALDLAEAGRLVPDLELIRIIASRVETHPDLLADPRRLARIGTVLSLLPGGGSADAAVDRVEELYVAGSPPVRSLAARVLDQAAVPVPGRLAARLLGDDAARFLAPYLEFTRAPHLDLAAFAEDRTAVALAIVALIEAERALGQSLLGRVLGEVGWGGVSLGLSVARRVALSVEGSFPLWMTPGEARLFEGTLRTHRLRERFVIIAQGRAATPRGTSASPEGVIGTLRGYHRLHAQVLSELLAPEPLTAARARGIVECMERIVADFGELFHERTAEAERLPHVFAGLRARILEGIPETASDDSLLGSEPARLVQMFEDPGSLDEVRTLHGLKRYLHQQGLLHVSGLLPGAQAVNRTVTLVVASRNDVLHVARQVRYVDFDPEQDVSTVAVPAAIALVLDAFTGYLLHDLARLPHVDVLGYGNEVHLYVHYRNHPVFVRLDLSPPGAGGMVDLEGFVVSQYEIDRHPDLSLPAIQRHLRHLGFDVEMSGCRLHARYDKERAVDLGDLLARARAAFDVLPLLMDLDWVLGTLDYPSGTRSAITVAWMDTLTRWGVLPWERLVTRDRRHLLREPGRALPSGGEEPWDGTGDVPSGVRGPSTPEATGRLRDALVRRGLGAFAWRANDDPPELCQRILEENVLAPLRRAVACGEVLESAAGLVRAGRDRFRRDRPAERFATLLLEGGTAAEEAVRVAEVMRAVERHMRLRSIGSVNGHAVQHARLTLREGPVRIYALRDAEGVAHFAIATPWDRLGRMRPDRRASWEHEPDLSAVELLRRLRRDNYLGGRDPMSRGSIDVAELVSRFSSFDARAPGIAVGERHVAGAAASPGRAAGLARFGQLHAGAAELEGAVIFTPALRPQDAPMFRHAAAVVSTGGGALSHAGLLALELQKPALIIPGRWRARPDGTPELVTRWSRFRLEERKVGPYHVVSHCDEHEVEQVLEEGALVVVDADRGTLSILGRDGAAIALFGEMRRLAAAGAELDETPDAANRLAVRGRALRAAHQLAKILRRIDRPALARFAVQELLLAMCRRHAAVHDGAGESGEYVLAPAWGAASLLATLLANPDVHEVARSSARECREELMRRRAVLVREASARIPQSDDLLEVVYLERAVRREMGRGRQIDRVLRECGIRVPPVDSAIDVENVARERLLELLRLRQTEIEEARRDPTARWRLRHLLRTQCALQSVLGLAEPPASGTTCVVASRPHGARVPSVAAMRRIVTPADGGIELAPRIGWKAAHLGEIVRVLGPDAVPAWFVLPADCVAQLLDQPVAHVDIAETHARHGSVTLRGAVRAVLASGREPAEQSEVIRGLWEGMAFPAELVDEIAVGYRALGDDPDPLVAVRSSAQEEDAEEGSWAGQFESFLFVRGLDSLIDHLRLALAGFWSERAIWQRRRLGTQGVPDGGAVIVQRMADARAAGVVHTVAATTACIGEMLVNAGLGTGEGIVSGIVEVDRLHVKKDSIPGEGPLRFRQVIGDKRERVVFDARRGHGTRREEPPFHQRMRPALDHADLRALVEAAVRLERVYGRPLDIEFAFENDELRVLQARPIAVFEAALGEAIEEAARAGGHGQGEGPNQKEKGS